MLATGAQPFVPPMEGLESHPNFHTFLELKDAKLVKESVSEETEAAILGAGLIGLEVAEELRHYTKQAVHVVELAPRLLPTICNTAASEILKQAMEAEGVVFHLENTVTRVEDHVSISRMVPSFPQRFIADCRHPRQREASADCGDRDQSGNCGQFRMETSASDIYAAGDVITTVDPVTGKPAAISLWSAAYAQGQCAGKNMAGQSTDYSPVPMVNDIAFFGVHVISALASNIEDPEARIYEQRWDDEYRRVAVKEGRLLGLLAISSGEKASGVTKKFRKALSEKSISQELLDDLLAVGE
ncbi:MAG: FAD-dependent oxidoreductase [Clostridia bacterium]